MSCRPGQQGLVPRLDARAFYAPSAQPQQVDEGYLGYPLLQQLLAQRHRQR